jgi:hypothetical protein
MVKLSNVIGFVSVLALLYWIFIFITMQIFDLKVFKENIIESFYYFITCILVLMFGSLMINIMFNLSRIAEKVDAHDVQERDAGSCKKRNLNIKVILFILSFPVLAAFLFFGDYATAKEKEITLKKSANLILGSYKTELDAITNYNFDKAWINNVSETLDFMSKIDPNFDNVSIILEDVINNNNCYLVFTRYNKVENIRNISKTKYIRSFELSEREYLEKVFHKSYNAEYFKAKKGSYIFFIPYEYSGKTIVLYFNDIQSYGK